MKPPKRMILTLLRYQDTREQSTEPPQLPRAGLREIQRRAVHNSEAARKQRISKKIERKRPTEHNTKNLQTIISQYNSLGDGRYFDTASQTSFSVDHATQVRHPSPTTTTIILND
jgi:hypothetical protein